MKTIIAATDYSKEADNAVNYAAALAKYTGSTLVLFNAFEYSIHVSNARVSASLVDAAIATNARLMIYTYNFLILTARKAASSI
ncbi:universal stress protein [Parafilimonas sp.]|uniref:universal stress protein n=1 Tax=Parafilimonas sp. TaxID=1969739 RepID=UPI0039E61673